MGPETPENADDLTPEEPELSEFEQAVAEQFQSEPEAPADGSHDPDPASDEVEPPEGAEETGEEEPTPEPEATAPETPAADDFIELDGQRFDRNEVAALIGWASQLGPEDFLKIRDALGGEPQPAATQEPETPGLDLDEVLDPKLAEYVQTQFGALQAEIEQLRAREVERIQAENAQQQELLVNAFTEARTGISERLGLTESDLEVLIDKTEKSGIVAYLSQQGGISNPKAMFERALETTFYMDPDFRERVIQKTAEERAAEQAELAAKKARAAAVGGKGNNASRTPDAPATKEERWADMVSTIARELSES